MVKQKTMALQLKTIVPFLESVKDMTSHWFVLNALERLISRMNRFLLEGSNLLGVYTPKEICISRARRFPMFDAPTSHRQLGNPEFLEIASWSINFHQEVSLFFVGVQFRFQTVWHSLPLLIYRKAVINNVNEKF